ncbi:MAG: DDE-type integrase/transposase/recombinase [Planctomycetes bacterium]|nr:DDE-type integrase/transposase/recombinase [Planctomycetota bacterium]
MAAPWLEREGVRHAELLLDAQAARALRVQRDKNLVEQDTQRRMERRLKIRALGAAVWLYLLGLKPREIARRLNVEVKTLRSWRAGWCKDHLQVIPRGRPVKCLDLGKRNGVIGFIQLVGPGVGLPTLEAAFRDVPRAELERILYGYRKEYLASGAHSVHALRWTKAGTVWAIDHLEPDVPVDGEFRFVVVARDLASGEQLLALPVKQKDMKAVAQALEALFLAHGAPLVLKADNAFDAEEVHAVLSTRGVELLLSPPETPRYNGSVEAGIGSLKTRTHHEAARNDRPGEWTCDDVEAGRLACNELGRPRGAAGPTPDELWATRRMPDLAERSLFRARVERHRLELRAEQGLLPGFELGRWDRTALEREAISRALVARGLLEVRRRRIPPPLYRARMGNIT